MILCNIYTVSDTGPSYPRSAFLKHEPVLIFTSFPIISVKKTKLIYGNVLNINFTTKGR